MQQRYEEIRRMDAEVLVVSFSPPDRVAAYAERHPLPFPVVSDPQRAAYRLFGLESASWWKLLRPSVLAAYVKEMFRGRLPEKPPPDEDVHQLGGDFILDAGRHLAWAHPSRDPADRPSVKRLLEELRAMAGGVASEPNKT